MRAGTALQVEGLITGYGGREVVRGVSFDLAPGELCAVLGPNGAGKSTLARAAIGLMPLWKGSVRLGGEPLGELSRKEIARRVAWVPQEAPVTFGYTATELLLMGRAPHLGALGAPGSEDLARVDDALERIGLKHLAHRPIGALSGGERRLLWFGRALVQDAPLWVLDEPTAFLDLRHQVDLLELLRAETSRGRAALVVLHDPNLAAAYADRALLLDGGRVNADGAVSEVLTAERLGVLYGVRLERLASREQGSAFHFPRPRVPSSEL